MVEFPTGKPHISYSELKTWVLCTWRHKKIYIDKIELGEKSEYLFFGTDVHGGCEHYLKTRTLDIDSCLKAIERDWESNGFQNVEQWKRWASVVLTDLPIFMDNEFPGWECLDVEHQLYEEINGSDIKFKGFVDAIIKYKDKRGKEKVVVIDWKTAGAGGWFGFRRRDPLTHLQLQLYKLFLMKKLGVSSRDMSTAFVLLKRGGKPGKSIDLLNISAGPKTHEHALKSVRNMISSVRRRVFIKNRNSCKGCEFYGTEHCT